MALTTGLVNVLFYSCTKQNNVYQAEDNVTSITALGILSLFILSVLCMNLVKN